MSTTTNLLHLVLAATTGVLLSGCTGTAKVEATPYAETVQPDQSELSTPATTEAAATKVEGFTASMPASETTDMTTSPADAQSDPADTPPNDPGNLDDLPFDKIADKLSEEHPLMIDQIRKTSETTVEIIFQAGDEACYGHRPVVEYDNDDISIGLVQGTIGDGSQMCKAYLRTAKIQVELEKPIGNRQVEIMDLDDVEKYLKR